MRQTLFLCIALGAFSALHAQTCDAPVCRTTLTVTLPFQSDTPCSIDVAARHLVDFGAGNCAPAWEVAIYPTADVAAAGTAFVPDYTNHASIQFDLESEQLNLVTVFLRRGTTTQVCESLVFVSQSFGCAPIDYEPLAGHITTYNGDNIDHVTVTIAGPEYQHTYPTNSSGLYVISLPILITGTYTITPERDDNPANGVTVFDISLVQKHIQGIQPITSPYRLIAADVNRSGSVTISDIIQMRRLILGIYTAFPNAPSWVFVPDNYTFPNPTQPWLPAFPQQSQGTLQEDSLSLRFIGIKIGDVNGNAQAN